MTPFKGVYCLKVSCFMVLSGLNKTFLSNPSPTKRTYLNLLSCLRSQYKFNNILIMNCSIKLSGSNLSDPMHPSSVSRFQPGRDQWGLDLWPSRKLFRRTSRPRVRHRTLDDVGRQLGWPKLERDDRRWGSSRIGSRSVAGRRCYWRRIGWRTSRRRRKPTEG